MQRALLLGTPLANSVTIHLMSTGSEFSAYRSILNSNNDNRTCPSHLGGFTMGDKLCGRASELCRVGLTLPVVVVAIMVARAVSI